MSHRISISRGVSNSAHGTLRDNAYAGNITARSVAPFGDREFGKRSRLTIRGRHMERFIYEQNLAHYRKVLAETTDPAKRQMVLRLLAGEPEIAPPPIDLKPA
jgi:hypothetical protein